MQSLVHFLVVFSAMSLPLTVFAEVTWSECRCMSLFVCPLAYVKNHTSKFHKIFCTLPVAVARSSSDGNAISYVLPVLWMTSCFCIIERMAESETTRMFRHLGRSLPFPTASCFSYSVCDVAVFVFLGRLLRVDLMKWVSNVRPSVHTKFLQF